MKNLLRSAAIAVASTALVAGGATAASAAPTAAQSKAVVSSSASIASDVSVAVAPFPIDMKSKIRVYKRGSKLTFRLTARYVDDAGTPVGIRRATIQVKKGSKWKTLKNVKLNSAGRGNYKDSDGKKRRYRMLIKPTSLYQGGYTRSVKI